MDKQEAFSRVFEHLYEQNELSVYRHANGRDICKYRTTSRDGKTLKCAIGALIPDDIYEP